nr:MAG TPA: hypothetical protein [Caudoviricetes sp.]
MNHDNDLQPSRSLPKELFIISQPESLYTYSHPNQSFNTLI